MEIPRIASVCPLEDRKLLVKFINGVEKIYDFEQILQREEFQLLYNDAFFKAVKVDIGGYGISWDDDIDLSEYELWTNGVELELA